MQLRRKHQRSLGACQLLICCPEIEGYSLFGWKYTRCLARLERKSYHLGHTRTKALGQVVYSQIPPRNKKGQLTPERLHELWIGNILKPNKKEAILGRLSNRKYTISWTCEELGTICDEIEPPYHIGLESGHKACKGHVFNITKKVILVEKEMIEGRVWQGLFEPAWGPYRNAHLIVPKKNGNYRFIISAVNVNWNALEDTRIPPKVEEFFKAFAGLPILSLIDIYSGYNQRMLRKDRQDYMAIPNTQGRYQPTRFVQGATNSV